MASSSKGKCEKSQSDNADKEPAREVIDVAPVEYHIRSGAMINSRFKLIKSIGKGAFANVAKAYDMQHNKYVALKIIKKSPKFHRRALNEITLMKMVNEHENNLEGKKIFATYLEHFTCNEFLFISIELLSMTLKEAINNSMSEGLPLTAIRSIGYQLFHGLRILSKPELNIIHGDLKPENLIFSDRHEYQIKICDFGCAQIENQKKFSKVGTAYYRAPEVSLKLNYNHSIDMWSTGCILAEAFIGSVLFKDSCDINPFLNMVEFLGMPPIEMLKQSPISKKFFNLNMKGIYEFNIYGRSPSSIYLRDVLFQAAFKSYPNIRNIHDEMINFIDLLDSIFVYDSSLRMSPDEAVAHRFITRESQFMVVKPL